MVVHYQICCLLKPLWELKQNIHCDVDLPEGLMEHRKCFAVATFVGVSVR